MKASVKVAQAVRQACLEWPFAVKGIMTIQVHEQPGTGTAAVDSRWRMFYDPDFVDQHPLDVITFVIQHEACHLLLRHHRRARVLLGTKPPAWLHHIWNVAADCAIHEVLKAEGIKVPEFACTHDKYNLPPGGSAEEYFKRLRDRVQKTGSQSEMEYTIAIPGGSCADGIPREWEPSQEEKPMCGEPGGEPSGHADGTGESDEDALIKDIAESARARGSTGRSCALMGIDEYQKPPKVSARTLLSRALRASSAEHQRGMTQPTYRRPSRRQHMYGNVIRPVYQSFKPDVLVVLDTSGSMGRDDLSLAVGMIRDVCRTLNMMSGVRVLTGDTHVGVDMLVRDASQIKIGRRGGTDMGRIMEHASKKYSPDIIIVVTDGYTPWPKAPLPMPCVACITQAQSRRSWAPPEWIHSVDIGDEIN